MPTCLDHYNHVSDPAGENMHAIDRTEIFQANIVTVQTPQQAPYRLGG